MYYQYILLDRLKGPCRYNPSIFKQTHNLLWQPWVYKQDNTNHMSGRKTTRSWLHQISAQKNSKKTHTRFLLLLLCFVLFCFSFFVVPVRKLNAFHNRSICYRAWEDNRPISFSFQNCWELKMVMIRLWGLPRTLTGRIEVPKFQNTHGMLIPTCG